MELSGHHESANVTVFHFIQRHEDKVDNWKNATGGTPNDLNDFLLWEKVVDDHLKTK
jgi:hypothetical protein